MKYLKTYEGWNPFKEKPIGGLTKNDLLMIQLDVQILNHEIFERDILRRVVGQLSLIERLPFLRRIRKYDFIVKEGLFWKFDFKKMMEYPGIKGYWSKSELLNYYVSIYNRQKDDTDFDTTGEVNVGGGDRYLHLIDIHRLLDNDIETIRIYRELNS